MQSPLSHKTRVPLQFLQEHSTFLLVQLVVDAQYCRGEREELRYSEQYVCRDVVVLAYEHRSECQSRCYCE